MTTQETLARRRGVRCAIVLAVLLLPAAVAHDHAGSAPSWVALGVVALALGPFAWFAATRTLDRPTMLAAALTTQVLSHSVFTYLHGGAHHGSAPLMIAAHAVAGAVTALALVHADEIWAFVDAALRPLRALLSTVSPQPSHPTLPVRSPQVHARRTAFTSTVRRRGPPVCA